MRIAYFGDGAWATEALERLASKGFDVVAVVLRVEPSDPHLARLAQKLGLPVLQPRKVNHESFLHDWRGLKADLNLSVSYDQIIRRPLLESAPLGFINFHAGMLPFYRGRSVINWAIINGETEIGVTAHYMDEGIDTGDIILQRSLPIAWTDAYADMLARVIGSFPDLVVDTMGLVRDGQVERRPQAHLAGSCFSRRREGDEWIDWRDSSVNIYHKIRGLSQPAPGARSARQGKPVILWKAACDPHAMKSSGTPGEIVSVLSGRGVEVKTGDSTILLERIQPEGEAEQIAELPVGACFDAPPILRTP